MTKSPNAFHDRGFVASYVDRVAQNVPGYHDIHRMASVLIDEHAPTEARVLVLGAGGGLETKAFALAHPEWTFDAVDPAPAWLDLAAPLASSRQASTQPMPTRHAPPSRQKCRS